MRICHKFVKEYFIFVMAFTQIGAKQALDESRSQFAVLLLSTPLLFHMEKQEQNT